MGVINIWNKKYTGELSPVFAKDQQDISRKPVQVSRPS